MASEALTPEALRATWDALSETTRTTITTALIAAAHAELRRIDTFYPSTYGDVPAVEPLGVLTDPRGVVRVHFHAHYLNYNVAQSGSDWADHYALVGNAVLDGETVGTIAMEMATHRSIREHDWDDYQAHSRDETVAATRTAAIARLCVPPPEQPAPPPRVIEPVTLDWGDYREPPRDEIVAEPQATPPREMESLTIVRCPCCGATDAGATEHVYEFSRMTCQECGLSELCDHEQIKDDWNVTHERPVGADTLPRFVPPASVEAPGFELTGDANDETRVLVHRGLGYAIPIPGRPRQLAPVGGTRGTSVILELDAEVTVVVRAEGIYAMAPCDEHLRSAVESAAQLRARQGSVLESVHAGVLRPTGATMSMHVSYPARGEPDDARELMFLTYKGEHPSYETVLVNIRYRTSKLDPFAWANLRTALLADQTWHPEKQPALPVWPATSTFAGPTLRLPLSKRASDAAVAKAAALSAMTSEDAQAAESSSSSKPRPRTTSRPRRGNRSSRSSSRRGCSAASGQFSTTCSCATSTRRSRCTTSRAWCKACCWAVQNRTR